MTPEEKLNQQVWEILQDIKEEFLATVKGSPVKYRIPNVVGAGIIPKDRRTKILYKLEEDGAFKIQRRPDGVRIGREDLYYLIINKSKFDEVYKKYETLNNPQSQESEIKPVTFATTQRDRVERLWKILANLKDQHDAFVNLPEREFFLGIADYIKFIVETPESEKIAQEIKQQEAEDEKKVTELEKLVLQEVEETTAQLVQIVRENKIDEKEVKEAFQAYKDVKEGRTQSSATLAEALWGEAAGVIRSIREAGYKQLVDKFIQFFSDSDSISDYSFSKYYNDYLDELKKFRDKRAITVWGSWDSLVLAYLVVHKFDEEVKDLDPIKDIWQRMNFIGIHGEMQEILKGSQKPRIQFIQDQYKVHLNRVHTFFTQKIEAEVPLLQVVKDAQQEAIKTVSSFVFPKIEYPLQLIQVPETILKSFAGTAPLTNELVKSQQSINAFGAAVQNVQRTIAEFGSVIKSAQNGAQILNQFQEYKDFLSTIPAPKSFIDPQYQKKAAEAEDQRKEIEELKARVAELEDSKKTHGDMTLTKAKKEIKRVIRAYHFIGKEKNLLSALLDFKPHKIEVLTSSSTNALSHLKSRVNGKLKNTPFFIDTLDGEFSDPTGSYQLKSKISSN